MRELILEITQVIWTEAEEKYINYSLAINKNLEDSFPLTEIDEIYDGSRDAQVKYIPNIQRFESWFTGKNFYQKVTNFLDKEANNKNEIIVLTIKSAEPRILGLPWEILLEDRTNHLPKRPGVILRRCVNEIKNSRNINLEKKKLYLTCFSKLKSLLGENDITTHVLDEIKGIYSLFNDFNIKGNLTKDNIRAFNEDYSFVHYGGHGDSSGFEVEDGFLNSEDLKQIKSELFFLNCCQSGFQRRFINSLCYNLIISENFNYIIGMQYLINSEYARGFATNFYKTLRETQGDVLWSFLKAHETTYSSIISQSHLMPVIYQK